MQPNTSGPELNSNDAVLMNALHHSILSSDDLVYLVTLSVPPSIQPARRTLLPTATNVNWPATVLLQRLCARKHAIITLCYKSKDGYCVDRRGVFEAYGAPYRLAPNSATPSTEHPPATYPLVSYNLYDLPLDLEIVMQPGTLLCVELASAPPTARPNKGAIFAPSAPLANLLFQGAVSHATLTSVWQERHSGHGPVLVQMDGPRGVGGAEVEVRAGGRGFVRRVLKARPGKMVVKLVSLTVSCESVKDIA